MITISPRRVGLRTAARASASVLPRRIVAPVGSASCVDSRLLAPPCLRRGGTRGRRAGAPSLLGDVSHRERVRRPTVWRHEVQARAEAEPARRSRLGLRTAEAIRCAGWVGLMRRLALARSPLPSARGNARTASRGPELARGCEPSGARAEADSLASRGPSQCGGRTGSPLAPRPPHRRSDSLR